MVYLYRDYIYHIPIYNIIVYTSSWNICAQYAADTNPYTHTLYLGYSATIELEFFSISREKNRE